MAGGALGSLGIRVMTHTGGLLDFLKGENIKAVFFVLGSLVATAPSRRAADGARPGSRFAVCVGTFGGGGDGTWPVVARSEVLMWSSDVAGTTTAVDASSSALILGSDESAGTMASG